MLDMPERTCFDPMVKNLFRPAGGDGKLVLYLSPGSCSISGFNDPGPLPGG